MGQRRAEAYKNLGFEEDYQDVIMTVLASIVLDEPIREEDRKFLRSYLQIKRDIPKEDIPVIDVSNNVIRSDDS